MGSQIKTLSRWSQVPGVVKLEDVVESDGEEGVGKPGEPSGAGACVWQRSEKPPSGERKGRGPGRPALGVCEGQKQKGQCGGSLCSKEQQHAGEGSGKATKTTVKSLDFILSAMEVPGRS